MTDTQAIIEQPGRSPGVPTVEERAIALWPRLDRRSLRHCRHDPRRIAALVSRRTAMPLEAILGLLTARSVTEDEAATWFG